MRLSLLRPLCKLCLVALVAAMCLVLIDLVWRGWPLLGAQTLSYLTTIPANQGRNGGVLPVLWTTLQVVGLGTLLTIPVALAAAILVTEVLSMRSRLGQSVADVLRLGTGVPAIVWGLACSAIVADTLGLGVSRATGVIALVAMLAPGTALAFVSALEGVPATLREQCLALGLSRWQALVLRVMPAAAPAMATGLGATLQRGMGDAAALVLTAGIATAWSASLAADGATLAVHVYSLVQVVPGALPAACAAAATLFILTLALQVLTARVETVLRRHS